jgi:hypothetical protein
VARCVLGSAVVDSLGLNRTQTDNPHMYTWVAHRGPVPPPLHVLDGDVKSTLLFLMFGFVCFVWFVVLFG